MKVLVSAIACHPRQGSEAEVGWKAVVALGRRHDLHVLTSLANREAVEAALGSGNLDNISFTFFGSDAPYHENRLLARGQSWLRYLEWIKQSRNIAADLCAQQRFDLIHHVTYSSWRVPSPLWSLGIPLVWGPVGGVAEFPMRLAGKLSASAAAFETLRNLMNRTAFRSATLKNCVRKAAAVVCSNKETFDALHRFRGSANAMFTLSPNFFSEEQIEFFSHDAADKTASGPLQCFSGGSMVGSKGLIFAIEAVHAAKHQGISCHFLIASCGPEIPYLQKVVRKLGLENEVKFQHRLAGEDYHRTLKSSHIFLLPSFRENAPWTILEAMLAGCVPVVVDASAQGDIVGKDRGLKVPVSDATSITRGICSCLKSLSEDRALLTRMGRAARRYVMSEFTELNYVQSIENIYSKAIKSRLVH